MLLGLALAGCGPQAPKSEGQMKLVRMAMQASQNDPAIAHRLTAYKAMIERATGLPVKLYQSSDYNGTIQAMASNQVDVAAMAGGGYANLDAQIGSLATPILSARDPEGALGYYSTIIVKRDSPFHSLADLKGHSLGYVDFNSTSGYIYPRAKMIEQGFNPDTLFSKTSFTGGHTQSVMAIQNGQFDAVLVEMLGGTPETGFSAGPYYTLARRGLIDPNNFRVIWTAGPIPNAALVVRTDRPRSFIDAVRGAAAAVPYDDPQTWSDIGQVDGSTYAAVDRSHYAMIIKLRAEDIARRRGHNP